MFKHKISAAPTIRRLPSYLNIIKKIQATGCNFISGTLIAKELHLEPIQVRKDIALTGITGKPKQGYQTKALIAAIENFLDWNSQKNAVIIGAGNLGTALTGYQEFREHGLHFVAAFDEDNAKIHTKIHGVEIYSIMTLNEIVAEKKVTIAVLTVPSVKAQEIAESVVASGITAIWNFTNVKLHVPQNVVVQQEDLTSGYALLSVMQNTSSLNTTITND